MTEPAPKRTGFFPVVAAGVATAALTSVACGKAWFSASVDPKLMAGVPEADARADMPLALALSLVMLAGWGVVLVTRGRMRRMVLTLALLAAVGVLGCLVSAPFTLPDEIRSRLRTDIGTAHVSISPTGWFVVAAVVGVLALASLVAAWVLVPRWPAMSSRYDAPGSNPTGAATVVPENASDTELWKALDAGLDPTDPHDRGGQASP